MSEQEQSGGPQSRGRLNNLLRVATMIVFAVFAMIISGLRQVFQTNE